MKKTALLLLLFFVTNCFSQFSKTHYIPPLSNSNSQAPQGQFMYISCPSLTAVNFKIIQLGGATITGTVSRDTPYVLNIGSGFNTQLLINAGDVNSVKNNKGYIVEAENLVYVTVRLTSTPQNFQAGGLVSKGIAALGTKFRIGGFLNTGVANTSDNHYTFASILATENNTLINFSDIKPGAVLLNENPSNPTVNLILNRGESYVIAVQGPLNANRDGLIGALISADKPIAVNCGSFAGTNGDANNLDLGFDQIVSAETTGTEYIFIKGQGLDIVERPLIIAHESGTDVFINGIATPFITLAAGEYVAFNGSNFSPDGNLFVKTSKKVFAYQGIGGTSSQANQNMHFLPPLSCKTPKIINNIPFINEVGSNGAFAGTVCLVTETGATLNFIINGISYTQATLPQTINGPFTVVGNPNYVTYTIPGLSGNVSVFSTKQVYLSYYGTSGAATYGGFYSGFTLKPEISLGSVVVATPNCIPTLSINSLSSFDEFQWYQNDVLIPGATNNEYTPLVPGFYNVNAGISNCISLISDKIPISGCASDFDGDTVNDNIDLDIDNDGISNCTESYGNLNINLTNPNAGTIAVENYSNIFTGTATSFGTQATPSFSGNADGSFVSATAIGKGNSVTQTFNFTNPISLSLEYVMTANASDLLSANGEFTLQVPVNKTITVLNPNDQLLIDTNYDGIFESGITKFSSFQIRFRLNNGGIDLPAGTGTFKFQTYLVDSFSYTHTNLSDTQNSKSTFKLIATCVPKDSDGDGIANQLDLDSDNDAIPDKVEALGANFNNNPYVDANANGLNDSFEPTLGTLDSDLDGVFNYLDLDSDNDGIYDLVESGSNANDSNFNGIADGGAANFGANGLLNSLETTPDSGILNYSITNSDTDTSPNYIDLDADADGCFDVVEAGFSDGNNDGKLGDNFPTVNNNNGLVNNATGYTTPNGNYIVGAPISITTQPANQSTCDTKNATFTIATPAADFYQWQVSVDGLNFSNITNSPLYSGATSNTLQINGASLAMNGYQYRVFLNRNGNSCGLLSDAATLTVLVRPVVLPITTLVQCDYDLDGQTNFNLTEKEPLISTNAANEVFSYYLNLNAANTADAAFLIPDPTVYNNSNGNTVWVRVENPATLCSNVTQMNLIISATTIPSNTVYNFYNCDDFLDVTNNDYDGISNFDFSSVENQIRNILSNPPSITIKYYRTEADADLENDAAGNSLAITNITNYRNIGFPNQQFIWVRVDSTLGNSCVGLGPYINLVVEPVPVANPVTIPRACDDDPTDAVINHNFDTSTVESTILNGQTGVTVTYFDQNNTQIAPFPNPFQTATQLIRVRVTNNTTNDPDGACFDETFIQFTVDAQPVANPVTFAEECDSNPNDTEVNFAFDTSNLQSAILGTQSFSVKYYSESGFLLSTPLPNPFVTSTQKVRVLVENTNNIGCFDETFIQFTVNELPDIELFNDEIVCSGINSQPITLDAGLISGSQLDYAYEWSRNGQLITGANDYTLTVTEDGVYTTLLTNIDTDCERIRTNTVTYSEVATIDNIIVSDLSDINTVTVVASGAGIYEYSIDNPDGPFQSSGLFENVQPGIHIVYINDTLGCGIYEQEVAVIGAPEYFTPNGDGFNDTWKVKGITANYFKKSIVYIFDRYGKLLKQIPSGQSDGWDGNFNGQPLPADDYWYALYVEDGRIAKGHFALKR